MVDSRLDPEIRYPHRSALEKEDSGLDAWVYELPLGDKMVTVAIGEARDEHVDAGIVYYPIYQVEDGEVSKQLGVYEVREDLVPALLDDEGAPQPELLGEPLLYAAKDEEGVKAQAPPVPEPGSVSSSPPQTAAQDRAIRSKFRARRGAPWIQKFMRNAGYAIVDNEAGGDCLFAAIRQGLESMGRAVSVSEMRSLLAGAATQSLFDGYETQYAAASAELERSSAAVADLVKQSKVLRARLRGASDSVQFALAAQAEELSNALAVEKSERDLARELVTEFAFMKGITTLEALRAVLQTQEYWGDTWAVSTLERLLNIKLVIFSKNAFQDKDDANVLLCGQANEAVAEGDGTFTPDVYLLLSLGGKDADAMHYELISYDGRRAFTHVQLPYAVRRLIVDKCLERRAGPYALIPEFRMAIEADGDAARGSSSPGRSARDQDTFQVYARSAAGPRPGQGAGETLATTSPGKYAKLGAIAGWRRMLADDGLLPAGSGAREIDGRRWASVTQYGLGQMFAKGNPATGYSFSLTSGKGALAKDPERAWRAVHGTARKGAAKLPTPDEGATSAYAAGVERARDVKFASGTDARRALLETGDANIQVYRKGAPARPAAELMELRAKIRDEGAPKAA